ncbi:MAG: 8-oxo-dGTP diphosphatase MutT [Syntrophus sp. (in: bacteria)]|nr:8-oxo-dGTP diphosphatase MutT [Syntrophus sp. (in: bacteria)]
MTTVVAAIIIKEGMILIGKRKEGGSMAHKWEFPGGKLEPGETPEECLKRELFEELGVDVKIGEFYCLGRHMPESPYGIELLTYKVLYCSGSFKPIAHEEIRWVRPDELGLYEFPHADRPIVNKLIEESINGFESIAN